MAKKRATKLEIVPASIKIDIGCGPRPMEGFIGLDQYSFDGKVKERLDLGKDLWPFADGAVSEARSSHFLEHLEAVERVHFFNELYRVLADDATAAIITPHWASNRAYGDPTHKWPPVSEMGWYYLSREWRLANAPHTDISIWPQGYDCDFEASWGYGMHPDLTMRNQDYQQNAMSWYKEAIQDMHATLKKRPRP